MTKPSKYDPEQLHRRLQEIESGTGKPYEPGEDPAVDAAMQLNEAQHPILSEDKMLAIGAGLLMTVAALEPPVMSAAAFNDIEAMLQAQLQLQTAPQPVMSDAAVNRIDMELRLQSAPRLVLSDEALFRIEQQLLQTAKPTAPFMSAAAILLALIGIFLAVGTMLNTDTAVEASPSDDEMVAAPPAAEVVNPPSPYSSAIEVAFLETSAVEVPAGAEPSPQVEDAPPAAPTAAPTIPSLEDVLELPPVLIVEGPLAALDNPVLVIYDLPFNYSHDTTLLDGYSVGDTVHIEGAVNPLDTDIYLILSIEPVYDGIPDRPVLVAGVGDEPDSTIDIPPVVDTATVTSTIASDNPETSITSGSTGDDSSSTSTCDDGDDRNQGRGQECNRGSGRP